MITCLIGFYKNKKLRKNLKPKLPTKLLEDKPNKFLNNKALKTNKYNLMDKKLMVKIKYDLKTLRLIYELLVIINYIMNISLLLFILHVN